MTASKTDLEIMLLIKESYLHVHTDELLCVKNLTHMTTLQNPINNGSIIPDLFSISISIFEVAKKLTKTVLGVRSYFVVLSL